MFPFYRTVLEEWIIQSGLISFAFVQLLLNTVSELGTKVCQWEMKAVSKDLPPEESDNI